MQSKIKPIAIIFCALLVGGFWAGAGWGASPPVIAKVTDVQGSALLMSGTKIRPIIQAGLPVRAGDRIQTKQGSVEVVFTDGAIVNVHPYTSTMIQEQEESTGFGFWKKKVVVRRVTCFIGKLWFKSGLAQKGERKNYLQTPTAVCGIRGSDGDIGFDGIQTYLHMYHGESENIGDVLIGFFENPGLYVAENSAIYNSVAQASAEYERAQASGDPEDIRKAVALALQAAVVAGESLSHNPDPEVAQTGQQMQQEAQQILGEMGFSDGTPPSPPPDPEAEPDPDPDEEDDPREDDPCSGAHPCDLNCDGEISYEEAQMCGEYISQ